MVRAFVENILGKFGTQLLLFYEAHSLIINIVVIVYGFILFFSWHNLVQIHRFLVIEIAKQIHLRGDIDKDSSPKKVLRKVNIPWEKAVTRSKFPFIAKMSGLLPKRKSIATLKEMLVIEDLASHALAVNNGVNIRKIMPNAKHMLRKDIEQIQEKNAKK